MSFKKLSTGLIFVFLAVVLSQAGGWAAVYADDIYTGCDYTTGENDTIAPSLLCTASALDQNRTLYGVFVHIKTAQSSTDVYAKIYDSLNSSVNSCQLINDITTTGNKFIVFPTPVSFLGTVDRPSVQLYSNSGCTTTGTGVTFGGNDSVFPYTYQVFYWSDEIVDDSTRIVSVSPTDGETVATSTTFELGALVNVNIDDWIESEDYFVRFKYIRQQDLQASVACIDCLYTVIDHEFTSWPNFEFVFEETSITEYGEYLYTVELRKPSIVNSLLGWFGLGNIYDPGLVDSVSGSFIASQRTQLDQFIADMATTTIAAILEPGLFSEIQDNCNPISGFDFMACITGLFIPSNAQLNLAYETARTEVLQKAPLGYASRFITILNTATSTPLPNLSYTFGSGPLEGQEFGFNFGDIVDESNVLLTTELVSDQDDPQNIWDVFMPVWNTVVYVFLAYLILSRVVGIYQYGFVRKK